MCIAAIAWQAHPRWRLVVAANRDEYHARPSAPAGHWHDQPTIIAGRDLQSGGTWLGVNEQGYFTLVTNHRVPGYPLPGRPSRGALVTSLLLGDDPAAVAIDAFNPFNLFCAAPDRAMLLTNYPDDERHIVTPGVHGLSNGPIGRFWPKTRQLCSELRGWLDHESAQPEQLFAALRKEAPQPCAPGEAGPEPRLSPVFIRDAVYGTRCSTVMAIDHHGRGTLIEHSFSGSGERTGETVMTFTWP